MSSLFRPIIVTILFFMSQDSGFLRAFSNGGDNLHSPDSSSTEGGKVI